MKPKEQKTNPYNNIHSVWWLAGIPNYNNFEKNKKFCSFFCIQSI